MSTNTDAPKNELAPQELIQFTRKRDFKFVRELGQGACGATVLLWDDVIDEHFVCKKYVPYAESERPVLFANFIREIKLLHQVLHDNVVRVFNYYIYPDKFAGFIVMEYVAGLEIDDYVKQHPERTNDVFVQALAGFSHLESCGILHRDIRPGNLMVRDDGRVKIIDLGFGKQASTSEDFRKSISLNWWCEPPTDFGNARYDFRTEVYFVGKLFELLLHQNNISHFKYTDILRRMCDANPTTRIESFAAVQTKIRSDQFFEVEFNETELSVYRDFANTFCSQFSKLKHSAKYLTDIAQIETALNAVFQTFMLEVNVPDVVVVLRCFVTGAYYYHKEVDFEVDRIRQFLRLLKSSSGEKKQIILANLHAKLDAIPRYDDPPPSSFDDDIPF